MNIGQLKARRKALDTELAVRQATLRQLKADTCVNTEEINRATVNVNICFKQIKAVEKSIKKRMDELRTAERLKKRKADKLKRKEEQELQEMPMPMGYNMAPHKPADSADVLRATIKRLAKKLKKLEDEAGKYPTPLEKSELQKTRRELLKAHGDYRSLSKQHKQESNMNNRYASTAKSREDEIFETIVAGTFLTVSVEFESTPGNLYDFRVRPDTYEAIQEGSMVVVEANQSHSVATVIEKHEDVSPKATAWVIQHVDTTAHDERSEQWNKLRKGVKDVETAKRQEVLMGGYLGDMEKYASPDLLEAVKNMPRVGGANMKVLEGTSENEIAQDSVVSDTAADDSDRI